MNTETNIFIAVAWPYVNGDIHVGHLAGYLIPCDIFSRFVRLRGHKTLMVSGSDCHGTPITVAADKKGVKPLDIVGEFDPKLRELIRLYGVSYDLFTTTETDNHKRITQLVFLRLLENGYISKKVEEQYFSVEENRFLPDRYVEGECPYCHAKDQRADQCENCGRTLGMGELIGPKSKIGGTPVTLKETEHYYLDFDKLEGDILAFVESKNESEPWREWVYRETKGWLKEGLQPRAITRDLDWGVEIPVEEIRKIKPELLLDNASSKRFYVWFDAVIGYLSAAIEYSQSHPETDWQDFWKNENTKHYYFMGKDNLAFHTIFWPGQLIGIKDILGTDHEKPGAFNLPDQPIINHFLNLDGQKFSKSRGIHIDSQKVGEFFGVDPVRFYLASILPESSDANWKWEEFSATINSDLVGNVGNFIHRTLVFYRNKLGSIAIENQVIDPNIRKATDEVFEQVSREMYQGNFVNALNTILKYSKTGNQYFASTEPWVSIKENRAQAEQSIYTCLQIVNTLRILLAPFIPGSVDKLSELLGIPGLSSTVGSSRYQFQVLDPSQLQLPETFDPLFHKIEPEQIEEFKQSTAK